MRRVRLRIVIHRYPSVKINKKYRCGKRYFPIIKWMDIYFFVLYYLSLYQQFPAHRAVRTVKLARIHPGYRLTYHLQAGNLG